LSPLSTSLIPAATSRWCANRTDGPLNVARLLDKQGDAKLTDDMPTLANCDKARVFSLYDRCKARYGLCP
jgi:hypothetical protein